jgi:hypothetical protein
MKCTIRKDKLLVKVASEDERTTMTAIVVTASPIASGRPSRSLDARASVARPRSKTSKATRKLNSHPTKFASCFRTLVQRTSVRIIPRENIRPPSALRIRLMPMPRRSTSSVRSSVRALTRGKERMSAVARQKRTLLKRSLMLLTPTMPTPTA